MLASELALELERSLPSRKSPEPERAASRPSRRAAVVVVARSRRIARVVAHVVHVVASPAMPLDISILRAYRGGDPEKVRESQRRRFADVGLVDKVIAEARGTKIFVDKTGAPIARTAPKKRLRMIVGAH